MQEDEEGNRKPMIKPLRDRIVIKRTQADTKSAGGIILTEQAQEVPTEGLVVACGEGLLEGGERQALDVKVGDLVLFPQFAGTEVQLGTNPLENETYLIMKDSDVFAIVKEGNKKVK